MVISSGQGLFYAPAPPPQSGGVDELRQWLVREHDRIASVQREGRSQFLRLDVLNEAPPRPEPGMVAFFIAAAVGPTEGTYEYRSDNAWHKL